MDVKYQVFVSSTFEDLQDERRIVMERILNLGHIPVGMEVFQASDDSQWTYIKERIKECDYYVVIVAERYGSEGEPGKSYTRMEYEFAVDQGIPVAAFMLHGDARKTWPRDRVEFEKKESLEAFRTLCGAKMSRFWKNADDLGATVITTLIEMIRRSPRVGWVQANAVASVEALSEIARLSEERRELQQRLTDATSRLAVQQTSPLVISTIETLKLAKVDTYIDLEDTPFASNRNLLELLIAKRHELAMGVEAYSFYYKLAAELGFQLDDDEVRSWQLLTELTAFNVLEVRTHIEYFFDKPQNKKSYILTEFGKQIILAYMNVDTVGLI